MTATDEKAQELAGEATTEGRHSRWPTGRVPWQVPASAIFSLIGLGISAYLTLVHYDTAIPLSCPGTGSAINCAAVVTSQWSVIFGLPVAAYGLIWHAGMFILFLPWAWRASAGVRVNETFAKRIGYARLIAVIGAIVFVLYLIHVELFDVHKICLWCTTVHVTTFCLLIIVISSTSWSLGQGWETETAAT